jgi:hypothetical protein
MFHHRAAETVVQDVIFDRADYVYTSREKFERAGVHRLDPARINERDGNSFFFELARGFFGNLKHVAQPKDRHVAAVLYDFRFANLEKFWFRFDFCARPRAAWVFFFAGRNKIALVLGIVASVLMLAFLFRHTIIADEAGNYKKIVGYGAGYWLWLTSAGLVIVSGATGLVKQK